MSELRLWLLTPNRGDLSDDPWSPWYDKAFGFVVGARSEDEARNIASEEGGAETMRDANPWLDPDLSTCEELTPGGVAGLVIKDFRSA